MYIIMSNDGRICFMILPDKNIMVFFAQNIVISWQPFLISCFTKIHNMKVPHLPRYHHRGTS